MSDQTRCPDCQQLVGVRDGKINAHQPPGDRAKCPGSGKSA